MHIRPLRTTNTALSLLAAIALVGAVSVSRSAAGTPAPVQKLLVRYLIFTATPIPPADFAGGKAAPPPASLLDLNKEIDFKLGKRPAALLDLLSKETPGYRFKLLLAGSVRCSSDGTCKIADCPRRGDSFAAQIHEEFSFKPSAPGVWVVPDRGKIKFVIPGSGGSERSGWSWDAVFPHVHVDHTQSAGNVTLISGVVVVYARCVEYA